MLALYAGKLMLKNPFFYLVIVVCFVGVGVSVYFWWDRRESTEESETNLVSEAEGALFENKSESLTPEEVSASPEGEQSDWLRRAFEQAVVEISADPSQAATILSRLKGYIDAMPPKLASEVMQSMLSEPAMDVRTGLGFAVGENGRLRAAPSLRVAMLDWLGRIDPTAAAQLADEIFARTTDPDEFAISLRNYAWGNPRAKHHPYLRERTLELATKEEWIEAPTAGTLEAFDVFVYARATEAADVLMDLASDQSPSGRASGYAAFLTLDRLYQQQPKELFAALEAEREFESATGPMVAQMMARSDVRQPEVRQNMERYLLSPNRTQDELEAFTQIFPNHNFMISDNLLTEVDLPSGRELRARDEAAYNWVHEKLGDSRFAELRPELERAADRLEQFLYPVETSQ